MQPRGAVGMGNSTETRHASDLRPQAARARCSNFTELEVDGAIDDTRCDIGESKVVISRVVAQLDERCIDL